jgi:hypothetical protein
MDDDQDDQNEIPPDMLDASAVLDGPSLFDALKSWAFVVERWEEQRRKLREFAEAAPRMNEALAAGRVWYKPGPIRPECIELALRLADLMDAVRPERPAVSSEIFDAADRALIHLGLWKHERKS